MKSKKRILVEIDPIIAKVIRKMFKDNRTHLKTLVNNILENKILEEDPDLIEGERK
jgi:hypothetical protein